MIDLIAFLVAFIGSGIAGFYDLKTTEIPDKIPHVMIAIGFILAIARSISTGSLMPLLSSFIFGVVFFVLGFLLYYFGQWGGGDAKLLTAIVVLLPAAPSFFKYHLNLPFPVMYLLNVFYVGAVYIIIYSLIFVIKNKDIFKHFVKSVKSSSKIIIILTGVVFAISLALTTYMSRATFREYLVLSVVPPSLFVCVWLLFRFLRIVEEVGFKKKIPVSKLRVGDVLAEFKRWDGATQAEVNKIKRSGKKYVWIKEGVRFGLVFPIALIFSMYYGDIVSMIFSLFLS